MPLNNTPKRGNFIFEDTLYDHSLHNSLLVLKTSIFERHSVPRNATAGDVPPTPAAPQAPLFMPTPPPAAFSEVRGVGLSPPLPSGPQARRWCGATAGGQPGGSAAGTGGEALSNP